MDPARLSADDVALAEKVTLADPCATRPPLELAVVIPTYNETQNIPLVLAALEKALRGIEWEVVFVDDNSPDKTAEFIRALALTNWRIRVLERIGRRGLSSACIEGILATPAPYIAAVSYTHLPSIFSQSWTETYFADSHRWQMHSYRAAAAFVQATGCNSVGLDSSFDDFDYPMFAILDAGHVDRTVRYSEVKNLTAEYARPDSTPPCAVICLRCANSPAKWAEYKRVGGRVSVFDEVAVFSPNGDLSNTQTFDLPVNYPPDQILQELDRYRETPLSVGLGPTEDRVNRAGSDYPDQRADLKARLDSLYIGTLSLWRVRDSVDPLRRRGEPVDNSKIDLLQLVGATEVTRNWFQTEPSKVRELNDLMDRLYATHSAQLHR